jgi:hypothetical protein
VSRMDDEFYVKKERLLRYVREGTATQEQRDWLVSWGFLKGPKPQRPKLHSIKVVSPVKKPRKRRKRKRPVVYQPYEVGQSVLHVRTRAGGRNRTERRGS